MTTDKNLTESPLHYASRYWLYDLFGRSQNHGINDVNHTVRGRYAAHDIGPVDLRFSIFYGDLSRVAVGHAEFHAIFQEICPQRGSCDVILQNATQFVFVFRLQQVFQSTGRQFGKGIICGCKNRKRPRIGQHIQVLGSYYGFDQSSVIGRVAGYAHYVFL